MKRILPIFLFFIAVLSLPKDAFATHNRAGEITYKCLGGYLYEITVTTYCKVQSPADRCDLTVYFGDGDSAIAPRINGPVTINCSPNGDGVEIVAGQIRKNIYVTTHLYPGDGQYYITMYDPNRNSGIVNIANSVNTPFYIKSFLKINSLLGGCNSSPILYNPPIDNGCLYKCFYHNPAAVDPDGTDSLSYEIALCLGYGGQPVQSYSDPYYPQSPNNPIVDAVTGDLIWCTPQPAPSPFTTFPQQYNFAMIIKEWRKLNNTWYLIGYVERDLQVDIDNCPNNPPLIVLNDTCVLAGDTLTFPVIGTDMDNDRLTMTASGEPFVNTNPLATFTPLQTQPSQQPDTAIFEWRTNCNMVRNLPYWAVFKATDSNVQNPLVYIKTIAITVVAPPPVNLTATPSCDWMTLSWSPSGCDPNPDHVQGYKIYRLNTCDNWVHSDCETGVPSYTGYTWIGSTLGVNNTTFIDDNGGSGLSHGVTYAYHVVAVMLDGAESYASNRVCRELVRDVPIMTNVDVTSTNTVTGTIDVKWVPALTTPGNLDTIAHPGPYIYNIYRNVGSVNAITFLTSFTRPNFLGSNGIASITSYSDVNLNTEINQYVYNVQMFAQGGLDTLCRAKEASSIFGTCGPNDNRLLITWNFNVPWTNYKYLVYRAVPSLSIPFTLIDSTTTTTFADDSLVNGRTYCYKIKAYGQYSDSSIVRPLINWSQEICCTPIDLTPPCAPTLSLNSDCDASTNTLNWNDPNTSCMGTDDVVSYNIYYTSVQGEDMALIATVNSASIFTFIHDSLPSIAGCYQITAVDSFGNQSAFSNMVCADNCPVYELPNVFTPNGDGQNDQFVPFPYRYVKDIKLQIFNRWGALVFTTEDPAIHWDGTDMTSKQLLSDGVYFYVCVVNEIHLEGIVPRTLKGFVQILQHKQ